MAVVVMRPIPEKLVDLAVQITEPMEYAHGGPVRIGDPAAIGIRDLLHPNYGDPPVVAKGDVPVFWACGVTAQSVAMVFAKTAGEPLTDIPNPDYCRRAAAIHDPI